MAIAIHWAVAGHVFRNTARRNGGVVRRRWKQEVVVEQAVGGAGGWRITKQIPEQPAEPDRRETVPHQTSDCEKQEYRRDGIVALAGLIRIPLTYTHNQPTLEETRPPVPVSWGEYLQVPRKPVLRRKSTNFQEQELLASSSLGCRDS